MAASCVRSSASTTALLDGSGKTTTSAVVQQLIPDSRVFDAEKAAVQIASAVKN